MLWFSNSIFGKLDSSIAANVPINGFMLPIFSDDGRRNWEIHGKTALVIGGNAYDVKGVELKCLSREDDYRESFRISSDSAIVMPHICRIAGQSEIKIFGPNFHGSADIWEFIGDDKKIIAKNNIKFFIEDDKTESSQ
ncbi:MAG: hypothetical protein LBI56_01045 [Puniceicoccales bacterium]|jgi:hypothetical protein|nr:hypothetical protein [Puniceicoccales bacterium]